MRDMLAARSGGREERPTFLGGNDERPSTAGADEGEINLTFPQERDPAYSWIAWWEKKFLGSFVNNVESKKVILKVIYHNLLACFRLSYVRLSSNKPILDKSGVNVFLLHPVVYQTVTQKAPHLIRMTQKYSLGVSDFSGWLSGISQRTLAKEHSRKLLVVVSKNERLSAMPLTTT